MEPWNQNNSLSVIPPVSLQDEIKTTGFGILVTEISCMLGILIEQTLKTDVKSWVLSPSFNECNMLLFVDVLLLDQLCHLVNKLTNLPLSFCPAFKQGLIFQKSLDRVVEVNEPLHMSFNMSQSIYKIYNGQLKFWLGNILKW